MRTYDHPANEFVFRFLGPATRFQGAWVRPHDLQLRLKTGPGAVEAVVARVIDLGFEIRVELSRADEPPFWVQLARSSLPALRLGEGQLVWVSPVGVGPEQVDTPQDRQAAVAS